MIGPAALTEAETADALNKFNHIVVIFQENHSFDNLFGLWGEVIGQAVNGLPQAGPERTRQVQADDVTPYPCLPQNDVNLTSPSPLPASCTATSNGKTFQSAFQNAPFMIERYLAPEDTTCPRPGDRALDGVLRAAACPAGAPEIWCIDFIARSIISTPDGRTVT